MSGRHGAAGTSPEPADAADHFAALVEDHAGELERYLARRLAGLGVDHRDVLQETWLKVWRALEQGNRPGDSRRWLFTIARNCAHDEHRGSARRREGPLADELPHAALPPEELYLVRETLGGGMRALQRMEPRQRDAFVAHVLAGDSHATIARAHGTTVPAVKALIHRARRRLRRDSALGACAPLLWLRRVTAPKTAAALVALAGTIATPNVFEDLPAMALPRPADMLPPAVRTAVAQSPAFAGRPRTSATGVPSEPGGALAAAPTAPDSDLLEYTDCEQRLRDALHG